MVDGTAKLPSDARNLFLVDVGIACSEDELSWGPGHI